LGIAGAEVDVDEAVVIEVGDAGAHDAHGGIEPGGNGDVGEGCVAVVSEEADVIGGGRGWPGWLACCGSHGSR